MTESKGCGLCMYYDEKSDTSGLCRRRVPRTPCGTSFEEGQAPKWPTVSVDDWCGEFLNRCTERAPEFFETTRLTNLAFKSWYFDTYGEESPFNARRLNERLRLHGIKTNTSKRLDGVQTKVHIGLRLTEKAVKEHGNELITEWLRRNQS